MNDYKKYAVIVAGGKGTRMGGVVPKQFLPFLGKPLMCYAVQAFTQAVPGVHLILVVPPDQLSSAQIVLKTYLGNIQVNVVPGGETRFHSVQNGLSRIWGDGIVFVHDGARPLISQDLIMRCQKQAFEKGSAIPCISVTESMRLVEDDNYSRPLNRDRLRIIQTPQTFRSEIILPAFKQEYNEAFTDEATVVEASGTKVFLIDGALDNIKVTTPEDMIRAEALYKAKALS